VVYFSPLGAWLPDGLGPHSPSFSRRAVQRRHFCRRLQVSPLPSTGDARVGLPLLRLISAHRSVPLTCFAAPSIHIRVPYLPCAYHSHSYCTNVTPPLLCADVCAPSAGHLWISHLPLPLVPAFTACTCTPLTHTLHAPSHARSPHTHARHFALGISQLYTYHLPQFLFVSSCACAIPTTTSYLLVPPFRFPTTLVVPDTVRIYRFAFPWSGAPIIPPQTRFLRFAIPSSTTPPLMPPTTYYHHTNLSAYRPF